LLNKFNTAVDDLIRRADDAGGTIQRQSVYKNLKELRKDVGGFDIDAPENLKKINKIVGSFEEYAKANLPEKMTARQLQTFKKNLYDSINWDAKYTTGSPIREKTLKNVARGAKEGVEELVPGVQAQNAKLSDLYELQPHLQRAANRIENRQLVPLTTPMEVGLGAGMGGMLLGPMGAAVGGGIGGGAALLGHPLVAPRAALTLKKLQEQRMLEILARDGVISQSLLGAGQADRVTEPTVLLPQ
jgi:uncharacterized spore protein YtfJ